MNEQYRGFNLYGERTYLQRRRSSRYHVSRKILRIVRRIHRCRADEMRLRMTTRYLSVRDDVNPDFD